MSDLEHTFPLPETATHQLEEVQHHIEDQRPLHRFENLVYKNTWIALAVVAAAGLLCGFALSRRH